MAKKDTGIRTRNLYDPASTKPFKLSRSKLERFLECPRCFYLDRRCGIEPPGPAPYTLNNAVDTLLKCEFDQYRARRERHPCVIAAGLSAVPFQHADLETWRQNLTGVRHLHTETNLIIHGAVDDIWVHETGELIVVDYKATSLQTRITTSFAYRDSYKRQLEIYQWLLRGNGFCVDDVAYLVYVNARKDRESFDCRLEFDLTLIPCHANASWVDSCVRRAWECLQQDVMPDPSPNCDYCRYRSAARTAEIGDVERLTN
jgi:RecB family exonuclease